MTLLLFIPGPPWVWVNYSSGLEGKLLTSKLGITKLKVECLSSSISSIFSFLFNSSISSYDVFDFHLNMSKSIIIFQIPASCGMEEIAVSCYCWILFGICCTVTNFMRTFLIFSLITSLNVELVLMWQKMIWYNVWSSYLKCGCVCCIVVIKDLPRDLLAILYACWGQRSGIIHFLYFLGEYFAAYCFLILDWLE